MHALTYTETVGLGLGRACSESPSDVEPFSFLSHFHPK